jgi:aminoglycoside phosphotransferase (APT) family kinase protein
VPDDTAALSAALQRLAATVVAGGGPLSGLRRLSGGASQQTWAFVVGTGAAAVPLILRRAASAGRGHGTAGLATEAALITAARAAGVPAPAVRHVLQPEDGVGEGFIMDRLDGETLGRRIVREPAFSDARRGLAAQCGAAMARIHGLATDGLPRLRTACARAELAFQADLHKRHGTVRPVFALALQWLARHAPDDVAEPVLVHGDFRNGNLMVGPDGLRGVLDWELAHLGDPMEDLGWICVRSWRFGGGKALPVAASARARPCARPMWRPAAGSMRRGCAGGKCWAR